MRRSLLFAAALTLAACDAAGPDALADARGASGDDTEATASSAYAAELAAVRAATAKYHRVERALADGWGAPPEPGADPAISPCVDDDFPVDLGVDLGAMGHHYINLALRNDGGALDPEQPEILLYEPTKNGRLRLVGVEYVVPVARDEAGNWVDAGDAPELFGQAFHLSRGAGGWALHVWVWKNNPSGMFADFNPTVSCDYTTGPPNA